MSLPAEGGAEKERYGREAVSLSQRLAVSGSDERAVWEVYAGTEKLIAVLKLGTGYETPGKFARLPDASDPPGLLREAEALLSRSADEIGRDETEEAIETLRRARNDLRSYLRARRRYSARQVRRAPPG